MIQNTFTLNNSPLGAVAAPSPPVTLDGYTTADGYIYSVPIRLENINLLGVVLNWTGGVGTFTIQVSNQHARSRDNRLATSDDPSTWTWFDYKDSLGAASWATSLGSPIALSFPNIPFTWARLKYVRTSGTITLTAKAQVKATGG